MPMAQYCDAYRLLFPVLFQLLIVVRIASVVLKCLGSFALGFANKKKNLSLMNPELMEFIDI